MMSYVQAFQYRSRGVTFTVVFPNLETEVFPQVSSGYVKIAIENGYL